MWLEIRNTSRLIADIVTKAIFVTIVMTDGWRLGMNEIEALRRQFEEFKRQMMVPNFACLTYSDLAAAAGCSVSKIRQHEREGKIAVRYPNAKRRFHPVDVDAYLRGVAPKQRRSM